jgi:two-component system, NtrC family, response regulator HydG
MSHDPPRILVVDDDVDICDNLEDILTDIGYEVDAAHDGPSAIELLQRRHYDVALLDYKMPGMDGLTLYREIRKRHSGTVALLVTAYASQATADEALSAGAWKVIDKPVDFARLQRFVEEAIHQPLVLVVDDDADLCANLWDLFRERGYRVTVAHDGTDAAEQIRDSRYCVVLIDMRLPGSTGQDIFRMVRDADPRARTILITGHRPEMDETIDQMIAEGADAVCYKPFDVPQLLARLDDLAEERAGETG